MSLAGVENKSSLFGPPYPSWVNRKVPPGQTSQPLPKNLVETVWPIITVQQLLLSPNLVWLAICVLIYTICPYQIERAKTFSWDWVSVRLLVNVAVTLVYCGYWHVSLYVQHRASRKFNGKPQEDPPASRVFHNVWYTFLGAVQWSFWECGFMHLWASGKLPYVSDEEVFSGGGGGRQWGKTILFLVMVVLTPVIREFHFYWAHRLLHFRVMYKHVHALHHRNVSPDPFSGLCMHPIEHLYYYATVWPSLLALVIASPYVVMSPFLLLWNGMHAVISPAAGHSGWEDHWQSDQFHYLHHAKFECNYGGGGLPFDKVFGTFADRIEPKRQIFEEVDGERSSGDVHKNTEEKHLRSSREPGVVGKKGEAGSKRPSSSRSQQRTTPFDSRSQSSHRGESLFNDAKTPWLQVLLSRDSLEAALPSSHESALFFVVTALLALAVCVATCGSESDPQVQFLRSSKIGPLSLLGVAISVGPMIAAVALSLVFGDSLPMTWPFHKKEALIGARGLHLLAGLMFTALPVYIFIDALVA